MKNKIFQELFWIGLYSFENNLVYNVEKKC